MNVLIGRKEDWHIGKKTLFLAFQGVAKVKIKYYVSLIFIILILCVILLIESGVQPLRMRNEVEKGKLYCFIGNKLYWSQLTDYCVKDDCLYVLFGDKGVLNVYDGNGKYKKSFAFMKTKGESELFIDNKYVYLFDQSHNYYVFLAGELVEFVSYTDYRSYLQKKNSLYPKDDQRKTDIANYYMKYASIYRQNTDHSSYQVIHRPWVLMFFQGITPFVFIAFWMVVMLMLNILSKKA